MKKEFKELSSVWGISNPEVMKLERAYDTIPNLKEALYNNEVIFLKDEDIKRLKEYFDIKEKQEKPKEESKKDRKYCISCGHELPNKLDRGICPVCGVKNII